MGEQPDNDYAALKRRLQGRIVFAVVILAGLLASLAVFDRMNAPEPAPEKSVSAPPASKPSVPAPRPQAQDTIKSEQTRPDAPAEEAVASAPAAAVPEGSATPQGSAPPVGAGEKPLTRPATGRHALMRPPEPAPPPQPPQPPRVDPREPPPSRPATAAGAAPRSPEPAQAVRPLSRAAERPAEKPLALQLGVFSDLANAEELRAKLEKAGIKASIEARVHVGPFATRAEADAARVKLRELGMGDALLLSMKGRKTP